MILYYYIRLVVNSKQARIGYTILYFNVLIFVMKFRVRTELFVCKRGKLIKGFRLGV